LFGLFLSPAARPVPLSPTALTSRHTLIQNRASKYTRPQNCTSYYGNFYVVDILPQKSWAGLNYKYILQTKQNDEILLKNETR
jgi:hypothetical protein